ncbi:Ring finger domain protein [Pleurostoma richardsiae]|uniref:Ring finger domain protein n=1 Tax=Pleurostoma richardsiae TaxID=41990 RepID=A0AA38RBA1_9PEZI|nr:Ring finger domain protein [Pleurostoma richardsiae]
MVPPVAVRDGGSAANARATNPNAHMEPKAGLIVSVFLSLTSLAILSIFLTQRFSTVKVWSRVPYVVWLVFLIYADSFLFVFATAVLQFGFGVDSSRSLCGAAIILCLICYVSTKFIYLFLVEKVYIIRGSKKRRMQSKLYIFNSFGMIGVYTVVVALQFLFRFTRMENGQCVIGMKKVAMIPLIGFDGLVNVYLTILFLIPLSGLYSFKNEQKTRPSVRLRTIAMRTFIGSLCTLASSIVNLTVLMVLDGEPGWVCLMCCNSDILFSAIVIHWVTSQDHAASAANNTSTATDVHLDDDDDPRRPRRRTGSAAGAAGPVLPPLGRRSVSPNTARSTKAVLEDVAEISVDDGRGHSRSSLSTSDGGRGGEDCKHEGRGRSEVESRSSSATLGGSAERPPISPGCCEEGRSHGGGGGGERGGPRGWR